MDRLHDICKLESEKRSLTRNMVQTLAGRAIIDKAGESTKELRIVVTRSGITSFLIEFLRCVENSMNGINKGFERRQISNALSKLKTSPIVSKIYN